MARKSPVGNSIVVARQIAARLSGEMNGDWTVDPATNMCNSSPAYLAAVDVVERIIRGSAHALIAGDAGIVARTIVSQLAYTHGFAPVGQEDEKGKA